MMQFLLNIPDYYIIITVIAVALIGVFGGIYAIWEFIADLWCWIKQKWL